MFRKFTKKRALLVGLASLIVASAAFAYWTTSGGGSGAGSVGSDSGVTIDPVTINGAAYPGGSSSVDFTITNDSANAPVKVGKVVADTSAGTNGITGLPVGCDASDFHFDDVTVNQEIAASDTYDDSGTLSMDNTSVNQDACKGASLTLHLKVDETGL